MSSSSAPPLPLPNSRHSDTPSPFHLSLNFSFCYSRNKNVRLNVYSRWKGNWGGAKLYDNKKEWYSFYYSFYRMKDILAACGFFLGGGGRDRSHCQTKAPWAWFSFNTFSFYAVELYWAYALNFIFRAYVVICLIVLTPIGIWLINWLTAPMDTLGYIFWREFLEIY
jgi:hypothetical protein